MQFQSCLAAWYGPPAGGTAKGTFDANLGNFLTPPSVEKGCVSSQSQWTSSSSSTSRGLRKSDNAMAFKIPWLAASDSKSDLPAQGAEDEVHNEEGAGEDQGDEVDPGPRLAH